MMYYSNESILSVRNLSVVYQKYGSTLHALKDINISSVERGSWIYITGSNGSGKSTFFKAITGEIPDFVGEVYIENVNLRNISTVRLSKILFFINQNPHETTVDELTVNENLLFCTKKTQRKEIENSIEKINLSSHKNHLVKNLSGGQRHLLALEIARLRNVQLLLLDEPFSSLDPDNQQVAFELIKELNRQGTTILFITHDMSLIKKETYSNTQTLIFNQGHIN